MKENSLEVRAVDLIKQIEYINISTVTPDGNPWGTPVYTAFDKELNFYWVSWKENQHSVNIHNDPHTCMTLYDSTVPAGTGLGVYMKGTSQKLTDIVSVGKGLLLLYKRLGKTPNEASHFLSGYPRRIYRFTPEQAWVNGVTDVKGDTIDIRRELDLDRMREALRKLSSHS